MTYKKPNEYWVTVKVEYDVQMVLWAPSAKEAMTLVMNGAMNDATEYADEGGATVMLCQIRKKKLDGTYDDITLLMHMNGKEPE